MCSICKDWKAKKITDAEAYARIDVAIKNTKSSSDIEHFVELSDTILDNALPVAKADPDKDLAWWRSTHGYGEDDEG